jgi:hypothetical protein
VNDFNRSAETDSSSTGGGMMPMSEHSYYLMQVMPKDYHWRFVTQLMYDKIDTMAHYAEELVTKMKAHKTRLHQEDDSVVAAMLSKLQTKSNKWRQARKSRKTRGTDCESNGSSSESEKHRHSHTLECYRCHKVGHIARYVPGTAAMESRAPAETVSAAAAAATTTTSIEKYWMTVPG